MQIGQPQTATPLVTSAGNASSAASAAMWAVAEQPLQRLACAFHAVR